MLEKLIKSFYDKEGFLKEEARICFSQDAMKKIITEFAELKMGVKK